MNKIDKLLEEMLEQGSSDIHLTTNHQPCFRIDGEMHFQRGTEKYNEEELRDLLYEFAPERNIEEL